MSYNLACIALSIFQMLSALGWGRAAIAALAIDLRPQPGTANEVEEESAAPRYLGLELHALGFGLIVQSLVLGFFALFGALSAWTLGGVLIGGAILLPATMRRGATLAFEKEPIAAWLRPSPRWLLLPPLFILFLESLIPDGSGDAYLYHISVPLHYVLEGGFTPQPFAFAYHYPLAIEMLYMPPIGLGLEQSAVLMNFWLLLASAGVLHAIARRVFDSRAAWIAVGLYVYSPSIILWTPTTHVETAATFFLLLLVHALLHARDDRRRAWVVAAGIFAGGLVGAKLLYALLWGVALLAIVSAALFARTDRTDLADRTGRTEPAPSRIANAFVASLLFVVASGLTYLLWPIKNAIFVGNPFFPFARNLFEAPPALEASAVYFADLHGLPGWPGIGGWFHRAWDGLQLLFATGDIPFFASALAVPILWCVALVRRRRRFFWTFAFALLAVSFHYGAIQQTRWFVPIYVLSTLALAGPMAGAREVRPRLTAAFAVVLMILLGYFWSIGLVDRMQGRFEYHRPWTALTEAGRLQYIESLQNGKVGARVNRAVPRGGRVLVMQSSPYAQVRWYRRRFVQNGDLWFEELKADGLSDGEIARRFGEEGITHVVAPLDPDEPGWITFLDLHATKLAEQQPYGIYELTDE